MKIANNFTPQTSRTNAMADEIVLPLPSKDPPLRQGSPEWKALLYQSGPARGVALPPEVTSREAIYGDDLR